MKVFKATSLDVLWFDISEIKVLTARHKLKFLTKFTQSGYVLCQMFVNFVRSESSTIRYVLTGFALLLLFVCFKSMDVISWQNKIDCSKVNINNIHTVKSQPRTNSMHTAHS